MRRRSFLSAIIIVIACLQCSSSFDIGAVKRLRSHHSASVFPFHPNDANPKTTRRNVIVSAGRERPVKPSFPNPPPRSGNDHPPDRRTGEIVPFLTPSRPAKESNRRRSVLSSITKKACITGFAASKSWRGHAPVAFAALPFQKEERRQIELCLVTVLRVRYWAAVLAAEGTTEAARTDKYVEARLGSKALLTGKIGGGANSNVYRLSTLQLRGCLTDGIGWIREEDALRRKRKGKKGNDKSADYYESPSFSLRNAEDASTEIIESLAACVEFDGMESLTDPSPRSSLMRSRYTPERGGFVRRMLRERMLPACDNFFMAFGDRERMGRVEDFVKRNYGAEVPPPSVVPVANVEEPLSLETDANPVLDVNTDL